MVNLFVESGLLSPEEAQTHPEANVLSRVVGIERSVDLDVSAPIKLDEGDVLLVCSDGVHSVLTDWEFGNVDWDMPQAGVQQALEMIAEREANDNATLVAIMMGQCDENISLTTPPEISSEASATLTPAAAGRAEQPPPSPPVTDESAGQPWQYSDDSTTSDTAPAIPKNTDAPPPPPAAGAAQGVPAPPPLNDILGQAPPAGGDMMPPPPPMAGMAPPPPPPPGAMPAPPPAPPVGPGGMPSMRKQAAPAAWRGLVLPGLLGLAAAVLFVVVYQTMSGGNTNLPQGAQVVPVVTGEGSTATMTVETTARMTTSTEAQQPAEPAADAEAPLADAYFAPFVPDAPKRIPHQPRLYMQPSPGGPHQWQVVQATRNRMCSEALKATADAMMDSADHAALYGPVWHCFDENHQAALLKTRLNSVHEFVSMIPNLQGAEPTDGDLPAWYVPATAGIEYRLQMWRDSTQSDMFRTVIEDLIGPAKAADSLAVDLLLESQSAVMLSRSARLAGVNAENADMNARLINWWARRVFVVSQALSGPVGDMIRTHRPELIPQIQNQLDEAAWRPQGPNEAVAVAPPQAISEAYAVGVGAMASPTPPAGAEPEEKPVIRRAPKPKPEPEVTAPFIIHRLEKVPRPLPGQPG